MDTGSPFVDQRRWFVSLVGVVGLSLTYGCAFVVWHVLPVDASGARCALILLAVGAIAGWIGLLGRLLPIVLLKVWPSLEG